jgi:hypothetical protein
VNTNGMAKIGYMSFDRKTVVTTRNVPAWITEKRVTANSLTRFNRITFRHVRQSERIHSRERLLAYKLDTEYSWVEPERKA